MMKTISQKHLILVFPNKSGLLELLVMRFSFLAMPLSLQILAALTPKDFKISIYNQNAFLPPSAFKKGALVGITCATFNAYNAYKIADRCRKAGATVVMGGVHVSQLPDEALKHCDSVVIGEAESVWPGLIKDFEAGGLQRIYRGVALDDWYLPIKDGGLPCKINSVGNFYLMLGRGCKYRCSFCVPFFGKPRLMKINDALGLVRKALEGRPSGSVLHFLDDNIFVDPVYAKELFKALIPFKIRWHAASSIDIAFDQEALLLLKESGCNFIFVGIESMYPKDFPKTSVGGMQTPEDLVQAVLRIQSYVVKVSVGVVLGLDNCTHAYCFELLKFICRSGFHKVVPAILTPFPGSHVYDQLQAESRITSFDWRKYTPDRIVFKPKHMSAVSLYLWHWILLVVGSLHPRMRRHMLFCVLAVLFSGLGLLIAVWAVMIVSLNVFFWAISGFSRIFM